MSFNGKEFSVYFIKGRAIVLPCKYEYRRMMGLPQPKLTNRAPFMFGPVNRSIATAFAQGWNHGQEATATVLAKKAVALKVPLWLKRRGFKFGKTIDW